MIFCFLPKASNSAALLYLGKRQEVYARAAFFQELPEAFNHLFSAS